MNARARGARGQHIDRLRARLSGNAPAPRDKLAGNRNAAAVLVPIVERDDDLYVVYIRRSDHVESHRGQVAFPGGRVDPQDASLLDAALREAREEVGIEPATVDVLGAFETLSTLTSGIVVAPFAGVIPPSAQLRPQPSEVAEIFSVPFAALADRRFRGEFEWKRENGRVSKFPAILYGGQTIWGLTLRITLAMLAMLEPGGA
jgi:8-oxo-dGTP pyrophosphatase MutT (NUDIX family)